MICSQPFCIGDPYYCSDSGEGNDRYRSSELQSENRFGTKYIGSKKFQESTYDLPIAFGKTITNEVFMVDLCKMPHVLVAGATGQGKSVGLNAIITSLLYKKHPAELKFVLVDPRKWNSVFIR